MIRKLRTLINQRHLDREQSRQREKALLRARLIAVAVARATHYAQIRV